MSSYRALSSVFCALLLPAVLQAQLLTRVTTGALATDDEFSRGAAWGDLNGDGAPELFVVGHGNTGETDTIYLNDGNGEFSRLDVGGVVTTVAPTESAAWADCDNDGSDDLLISVEGNANFLYRNDGSGVLEAAPFDDDADVSEGVSWADLDGDGNLDLYVTNILPGQSNDLYLGAGDCTFTQVTGGPAVSEASSTWHAAWADYDGDGDADLFVAHDGGDNFLFRNDGGALVAVSGIPPVADGGASRGVSWGDLDNDGDFDLFVTNYAEASFLYLNDGAGSFVRRTMGPEVTAVAPSQGSSWGDFDNDGDLDLVVANEGANNFLYENEGGTFTATGEAPTLDAGFSWAAAWADVQGDGFLDLLITNITGPNFFYENAGNGNHWLQLRLVGTVSPRTPFGAVATLSATIDGETVVQTRHLASQSGFLAQQPAILHFGLGDATAVDSLQIRWPAGGVQTVAVPAVDQRLTVVENPLGEEPIFADGFESGDLSAWSAAVP